MRLPALAAAMYIYICVLSLDSCCSSTDARTFEEFNVDILRVRARAHRHTPLGGNDLSDTWLSTQLQVGLTYAQLTGLHAAGPESPRPDPRCIDVGGML